MTEHEKRIREALEAGPVQYACHVDGPDGIDATCVLDSNRPQDCFYARRLHEKGLCKTDCAEWQPINMPKSTVEVSAANLRSLLADLDAVRGALERIAADGWKKGDTFCHPEGCESPGIAAAALKGATA